MLSKDQIELIVQQTLAQMTNPGAAPAPAAPAAPAAAPAAPAPVYAEVKGDGGWMFDSAEVCIEKAAEAQKQLIAMGMKKRYEIVEAMRKAAHANADMLGRMAREETGYGRNEHKIAKIHLAADKTPGPEDVVAEVYTGDRGMTLVEQAPFGVIGSITPSTNPPSTVVNNSISMISAGNAVVFNPHPAALKVSQAAMRVMHEAIVSVGGPAGLVCCPTNPNMETSAVIMSHPKVKLLSITGGEGVVKVAMKSGKKAICAGPGNPPVIVDETADIVKAGRDIVEGASFDNNILCIAEKEGYFVNSIFDQLMAEMQRNGAWLIRGEDIDKIVNTVLIPQDGKHVINRKFVGHDATYIMDAAGVYYTGNPVLIIAEVPNHHPFVETEMLMPVLGCVRCADVNQAIDWAVEAEHECWHSAIMHSTNYLNMTKAAKALNTTIFTKNAPSTAALGVNSEGFTTLTIATPTGEGLTRARTFTRARRCVLEDGFRII